MIFKGNFLYTPALGELTVREGEYLVVEGEKCAGFYRALPQEYAGQSVTDFGRALVLPAFCDLHLHAPQMVNRGVGYDQELLPWLETYTFPVEARYGDTDFAEAAWKRFLNRMWANGTLRFSAFATIHKEAAWRLMELTEQAGLSALIGKVNMDRNAPDSLREDTDASLADTEELICRSRAELKHVEYILTPRFVPSTTARLMDGLGRLGERYGLPVQSHLSENRSEIAWVGQLHPECASYTEVYRDYGLLRRGCTIMAHAVHLTGREEAILREEGVTLAHCAQSNTNLSSGVMPLRRSLSEGRPRRRHEPACGGHGRAVQAPGPGPHGGAATLPAGGPLPGHQGAGGILREGGLLRAGVRFRRPGGGCGRAGWPPAPHPLREAGAVPLRRGRPGYPGPLQPGLPGGKALYGITE